MSGLRGKNLVEKRESEKRQGYSANAPTVDAKSKKAMGTFEKNINKWVEFLSWARFFPDLFLDLITPETGGIRLGLDQRVLLRSLTRFYSTYGVFPRGYGKTFVELLALYLTAILYPDCQISMSAQTKESSAKLFNEKHREICKFYPLIGAEVVKSNISKDTVEITFASGSVVTNLANSQSSKGLRRHRITIEESALVNDEVFQDCLEPIPNIPRRTIGKDAVVNPYEQNGQINFFTTAYFKNTEYERNINMYYEMCELKGKMVLGSDWQLAVHYGRGELKSQILSKKERLSPIFFATNYESNWVGTSDNCIVDINKLMDLRVLPKAEVKGEKDSEYYIGVDVARSSKTTNNQTSISIIKVKRGKNEKVKHLQLVNLINLPNGMNFTGQAIAVKKIKKAFNAVKVIIDSNGLGVGLVDELLKSHIDPISGDELIAYDTLNTDFESDELKTDKCLFCINAQGINTNIIVSFMNSVDSAILQLLDKVDQNNLEYSNEDFMENKYMPSIQTDFFIEEVANLQLKQLNGGKLAVERNSKKYDKDRYSSVAYCIYYILEYENKAIKDNNDTDISSLLMFQSNRKRRNGLL